MIEKPWNDPRVGDVLTLRPDTTFVDKLDPRQPRQRTVTEVNAYGRVYRATWCEKASAEVSAGGSYARAKEAGL